MKYIFLLFILIFTGCSFKTPPDQWRADANSAAMQYQQNYLKDNLALAQKDYERAIEYAKTSAFIDTLARIELTRCALKIMHGKQQSCKELKDYSSVSKDPAIGAYQAMLEKNLSQNDLSNLPKRYRAFAKAFKQNNTAKSIEAMKQIDNPTSRLLAGALVRQNLTAKDVQQLIDMASYHGYKKSVMFWLEYKSSRFEDEKARTLLRLLHD